MYLFLVALKTQNSLQFFSFPLLPADCHACRLPSWSVHLTLFSLVFSARLFRPLLSGRFWSPSGGLSPSLPACLSWDEKGYPCPTRRLPVALRCCVCRLQIPWPHLTQVLTAGPRRVWPPLLAGLPHPSNPPRPFPLHSRLSCRGCWVSCPPRASFQLTGPTSVEHVPPAPKAKLTVLFSSFL